MTNILLLIIIIILYPDLAVLQEVVGVILQDEQVVFLRDGVDLLLTGQREASARGVAAVGDQVQQPWDAGPGQEQNKLD